MKVFQTSDTLIIKENPGCLWIFGLFFAAFGVLFVYGAFNGFVIFGIQTPWAANLTFLLGLLGIGIGIWTIYKTPISNLEIDKTQNQVSLTRWGIFGKQTIFYNFDEIERFCLLENAEGNISNWTFGIELINGEKIPITSLGNHPENYEDKYVYPLNIFIGKELPSCQLNFESQDESETEIT
ncbi:MAG: hypothetical protein AAB336_03035 [Acidobacteriota bacterium]